jgi:hypothetical protein
LARPIQPPKQVEIKRLPAEVTGKVVARSFASVDSATTNEVSLEASLVRSLSTYPSVGTFAASTSICLAGAAAKDFSSDAKDAISTISSKTPSKSRSVRRNRMKRQNLKDPQSWRLQRVPKLMPRWIKAKPSTFGRKRDFTRKRPKFPMKPTITMKNLKNRISRTSQPFDLEDGKVKTTRRAVRLRLIL